MRALKTAQFAWIFAGKVSGAYKILRAPPDFFLSFDLTHCKTFSETATVLSEYRDVCKSRLLCILMLVVKRVSTVF